MIRTEPIQPMSYRHPRYHNQKTPLEPYEAMALALFVLIPLPLAILFIAGAANSAPIVRKGQFCPISYYRIGEYCAPSKSTTPPAVRIIDETCPLGTYTQSNYCVSLERAK